MSRVVHCQRSTYDVYIGRKGKWGNPFLIGVHGTRSQVCELHIKWIDGLIEGPNGERPPTKAQIRKELKGMRLGCWCAPKRCHGDYLALIANRKPTKGLFNALHNSKSRAS